MKNSKENSKKVSKKIKKEKVKFISTSSVIFAGIQKFKWNEKSGKESLVKAIEMVLKVNPESKYSLDHHNWYLSKFRKQKKEGLTLDKLHTSKVPKAPKVLKKKKIQKKKKK